VRTRSLLVAAALALQAFLVPGEPAAAADPDEVKAALSEIQAEYRWKDASSARDVAAALAPKFDRWGQLLATLSAAGRHDEADRICTAIVSLWKHVGRGALPWDAFLRDRFVVGDYRVDAAQFFEPAPFYPGDDKIMKLYRFSLYKDGKVVARYYLEHSQLDGAPASSYYVLTFTKPGLHQQVQPYGREPPAYRALRKTVLEDIAKR